MTTEEACERCEGTGLAYVKSHSDDAECEELGEMCKTCRGTGVMTRGQSAAFARMAARDGAVEADPFFGLVQS